MSNRQIPTEHKTQTSQENDKYNDSKPFISSHFTSCFFAPEYKVEFTAAQEKRFPNTASYKSTTSYLRYLQPQHQTATKYDTMVVAVKKKQCQSKNRQLQTAGQTRHSSMQMSFVRRSKVGHRAKASYYSDERPSLEKSRLKPQSPDLQ